MKLDIEKIDVFVPSASAAFRRIGDEVIIVDTAAGKMMSLNETGSAVWELLGNRSVDEICRELAAVYEVDAHRAAREVSTFLQLMLSRGLIERASAAAADQ